MKRKLYVGAVLFVLLAALGIAASLLDKKAAVEAAAVQAPRFEVDPMWPKPLPNHWILGETIGVSVDGQDHIWIIHRAGSLEANERAGAANPPNAQCCAPAPPILEFDEAGNLINHWGGPGQGYDWPDSNHGITVDYKGNVWIGGNGRGAQPARPAAAAPASAADAQNSENVSSGTASYNDNMILKFTQDGKFLMQIGKPNHSKGSNDVENLRLPAKTFIDKQTNEAYVADGYGNHRVIVFDADTGQYKRHWGAYGHKPDDANLGPYDPNAPPAQQFRNPVHCAEISVDRFLYVCDRINDRIQVFKKDGTFVKEWFYEKSTLGNGAVWDVAIWPDPKQTYLLSADGENNEIRVLKREDGTVVGSFGHNGRNAGQFHWVHAMAVDTKGNVYTAEVDTGKRIQKFRLTSDALK
jgi:DNA-binding beta-propeller fold protein YncE